jgi:hypothetical protein
MKLALIAILALLICGCASVDVTQTAKGYRPPTDPNQVEILKTTPQRPYEEIAEITVNRFRISQTAKMHNALRAKAAPLGANAVVITTEGYIPSSLPPQIWASGVAIRWKD